MDWTSASLIAFVSIAIAILLDWFPGLAAKFNKLADGQKRGIVACLLFLTVLVIFGLGCLRIMANPCTVQGAVNLILLLVTAIASNQGFHSLFKPTENQRTRMFG